MQLNSTHLVDPDLKQLLDASSSFNLSSDTLPMLRSAIDEQCKALPADDLAVHTKQILVLGPKGAPDVRVLVHRPTEVTGILPVCLHLHGGGYVVGRPEMDVPTHRWLSVSMPCVVVSVDYRLAPETPAPGSVEDAYAVLSWLNREAEALGIDTSRVVVAGESAGGGLAAALTQLVRDRREFKLAAQVLRAPMLDDRTVVRADPHPLTGQFVWTVASNHFGWRSLLGREPGSEQVPPYASPARMTDLSGLPPAFIDVGALDLFLEEDLEYARRLTRAGVPVELHVHPGAFHGYEMAEQAPITLRARAIRHEALKRFLRNE